jgi:hypothetical protein
MNRMLASGETLHAKDVEKAVSQLSASVARIEVMEKSLSEHGDAFVAGGVRHIGAHLARERQELARATDVLQRIGAGENPSTLASVTPKARGVAARHGASLAAFLRQHSDSGDGRVNA